MKPDLATHGGQESPHWREKQCQEEEEKSACLLCCSAQRGAIILTFLAVTGAELKEETVQSLLVM